MVLPSCPFLEGGAYSSTPSAYCPAGRFELPCLPDSLQTHVSGAHEVLPVAPGLSQCLLPVEFSSPSNHCISDCFRSCCNMLHSIVISPLIGHSLGACRPLSTTYHFIPATICFICIRIVSYLHMSFEMKFVLPTSLYLCLLTTHDDDVFYLFL